MTTSTNDRFVDRFVGYYDFLSNFYPSAIVYGRLWFPTVEHAFQAMKSKDQDYRLMVAELRTAAQAKRAGRAVTLRDDWDEIKDDVMLYFLRLKFTDHAELRLKLLATHPMQLVEGNTWGDTYWGVCNGVGENRLGQLLMKVREELLPIPADTPLPF